MEVGMQLLLFTVYVAQNPYVYKPLFPMHTTHPLSFTQVNITSAPPLYTSRSNAEFVFAADDANATFACALLPGSMLVVCW